MWLFLEFGSEKDFRVTVSPKPCPPIHNMGSCGTGRLGESPNAWKHFGPEPTRAIEPQHRPPGQRWILEGGLRVGGPGKPPFWRTLEEFCTVRNSAR
jgi:hypothetical protein